MRRCLTPAFVFVAAMSLPLTAFAEKSNCPPGAWFCAEDGNDGADPGQQAPAPLPPADVAPPPPADELPPPPPPAVVAEPDEDARPLPPPVAPAPPVYRGRRGQPPVVIYRPAPSSSPPPQIIIIAPGGARTRVVRTAPPPPVVMPAAPPAPPPVPLVTRPRWQSEWGLNLRLEGLAFGDRKGTSGPSPNAGMGGFGLSLRYRPVPAFAFDAGIDVVGGTDYNGFQRVEMPLSLSGILYLNPRSRAQFYFTGGVNWSHATVSSGSPDPRLSSHAEDNNYSTDYSYFGGQGGIGLEFRISRRVGLNVDALGFVRKRTDDNKNTSPEFIDAQTGKTTNTSGGALFRGGLTFWW